MRTFGFLPWAGVAAWAAVAAPVVAWCAEQPELLGRGLVWAWGCVHALFLGALLARVRWPRRGAAVLLVSMSALALASNWLLPVVLGGVALGGVLLVIVAASLPPTFGGGAALAFVLAQSFALFWVYLEAWGLWPAAFGAGAYAGFQGFAVLAAATAHRERAARMDLAEANAMLRATRTMLADQAAAAERGRIGHELHDVVGHHLVGLAVTLEAAHAQTGGNAAALVGRALATSRLLLADVRSLLDGGTGEPASLAGAIREMASGVPGLRVAVGDLGGCGGLGPAAGHAIFRATQELLTNTVRHAGARSAWIEVRRAADGAELVYRDDGRVRPPLAEGLGLRGMRQRLEAVGGSLELGAGPEGGLAVRACVPIGKAARP